MPEHGGDGHLRVGLGRAPLNELNGEGLEVGGGDVVREIGEAGAKVGEAGHGCGGWKSVNVV